MKSPKKRRTSKIVSALTAVSMIGALSATSFAAAIGANGTTATHDTTVTIPKGITVVNDGYTQSWSPNVTFSFNVAPATIPAAGAQVQDASNVSASVVPGPADGISSTATAVFTSQEVSETSAGATALSEELRSNITLEVDLTAFQDPGVYRYTISDVTPTEVLYNAGIVRNGDYDTTRELDVYIVRDPQSGTLGVEGYVLTDDVPGTMTPDTLKSPGFVDGGDIIVTPHPGEDGQPGTADDTYTYDTAPTSSQDIYETYNLDLTKLITGNMADPDHEFHFTINSANSNTSATTGSSVYVGTAMNALTGSNSASFSCDLHNNESYYVVGLNPFAVLTITETNNTTNTYKVTTSDGELDQELVQPGLTAQTVLPISTYATANSASSVAATPVAADALTFTNDFSVTSVTGVLMRVAPFVAVAALIAALFASTKIRAKKENDQ